MKLPLLFSSLRPSARFSSALLRSALLPTALLAASLTACAVDPPPSDATNAPSDDVTNNATNPPAGEPARAIAISELETLACEPYDPAYCDEATSCEVPSQYVQCNSGVYMFAHRTPDCRWCIPRDVCGWNPPVCPF